MKSLKIIIWHPLSSVSSQS